MTSAPSRATDFAGFIDGFEARNLDSVQKSVSLQLSEMNTRSKVLSQIVPSDQSPEFSALISVIDSTLRDPNTKITDKLTNIGGEILQLVISQQEYLKGNPNARAQLNGFIVAYIEAAEASRSNKITDVALKIVQTCKSIE